MRYAPQTQPWCRCSGWWRGCARPGRPGRATGLGSRHPRRLAERATSAQVSSTPRSSSSFGTVSAASRCSTPVMPTDSAPAMFSRRSSTNTQTPGSDAQALAGELVDLGLGLVEPDISRDHRGVEDVNRSALVDAEPPGVGDQGRLAALTSRGSDCRNHVFVRTQVGEEVVDQSLARLQPEELGEGRLEARLVELAGLQATQEFQGRRVGREQVLDGLGGEAAPLAEARERRPDRGGQDAAEVDDERVAFGLYSHRLPVLMAEGTPDGIDGARVEAWFAANVPGAAPPLGYERISGGRSNITYGVSDSAGNRWALRRPPLGKRLASAHDMAREHRIIAALQDTEVPVPEAVGLCEDESVNGAPFYVMGFVEGPILRNRAEAEAAFDEAERRAIGDRVVDTLLAIHSVEPDSVGLGDLARKEDYVARQLHRWHGQWEKSKTREIAARRRRSRPAGGAHSRPGPGDDRPRRLPARQHDPGARWPGRRGRRLGALHARRPACRRWTAAGLLVGARATSSRRSSRRRRSPPASRRAMISDAATRNGPAATFPASTTTLRSASGSWRSSSRGSTRATPPASTAPTTTGFEEFANVVVKLAEGADAAERRLA